ncbi:unnamed protein product [Linum tenue]|uniref:Uncharacterized protein n=1 Tax=Linum tenue TaxID=586396 RepID=A0AAV0HIT3_9ROSI|nr:unnamed protein product [Linum tenue]
MIAFTDSPPVVVPRCVDWLLWKRSLLLLLRRLHHCCRSAEIQLGLICLGVGVGVGSAALGFGFLFCLGFLCWCMSLQIVSSVPVAIFQL